MTTRTRKFVAVTAAAMMGIGLAACSTGGSSESKPASGQSEASKSAVEVTYVHRLPDADGMTKVAELAEKFNAENPDIKVTAVKWDGKADEMIKKIEADVKAGTAPCLAQAGYGEVPELFVKGIAEDVTSFAETYKGNFSGAYGMMKVGDAVVGLPQDTGPLVYYYNKAAFEALGITAPTNLEEFKAAAAKAAEGGKFISAFLVDEAQYWLSAQAAAAGAEWFGSADNKWVVNTTDEKTKVVADFWQGQIDAKTTLVTNRWDDSFKQALVEGKLIGTIGAAWEAPLLVGDMKGTDNEGKWAVAQLPDFGAGAKSGPDGGSGVIVVKGCKFPEQAMKFNNWLNTQVDALVSQGLVVAATTGAMTSPEDVKAFYGGQDVAAELGKANAALAANFPYIPSFSALGGPMKEAADAAAKGTGKMDAVFEAAGKAAVQALKDLQLPVAE